MPVTALFPTLLDRAGLDDPALVADLEAAVRGLARDDAAGRRWSRENGYRGYTSYASLDDLPRRDPAFGELKRRLDGRVAAFARACGFELNGRRLRLDSLWCNLLKAGGHHSAHLHPHAVVSGTVYVAMPDGAGSIRFEDPRLSRMMAAPIRPGLFETVSPEPGDILLWESWLRHEVEPNRAKGDRISVSFNYRW